MAKIHEYQVFIASPGDVPEERAAARDVCRQLSEDPLIRKGNAAADRGQIFCLDNWFWLRV